MQDEGSAHSEDAAEKPRLEDDVVARRCLTRRRLRRCRRAVRRPVVLSEHECREVHFTCQLEETLEGGGPGIERRRPGLYVRDGFETATSTLIPGEPQLVILHRPPPPDDEPVIRRRPPRSTENATMEAEPAPTPMGPEDPYTRFM